MATLQLIIEAGKVVDHNGVYFESISENGLQAFGNGWEVTIRPATKKRPGRIIAHCERMYSDGPAVCHREFRLEDGTLGLAGGNVYDRYAYFRKASFQQFLDEFGITAVKREDPNQDFTGFSAYSGAGNAYQNVESDGKIAWGYEDEPGSREYFERPGNNPNLYRGMETHAVTGATWAIVERKEDYRDNHNYSKILYTLTKDVTSLAPELRRRKERKEKIARVEQAMNGGSKRFDTALQMRTFVEGLAGSFPLTPAEQPGEVVREPGRWDRYSFNGIEFTIPYPMGRLEGKTYGSLDEVGECIRYRACLTSGAINLYANSTKIGTVQL